MIYYRNTLGHKPCLYFVLLFVCMILSAQSRTLHRWSAIYLSWLYNASYHLFRVTRSRDMWNEYAMLLEVFLWFKIHACLSVSISINIRCRQSRPRSGAVWHFLLVDLTRGSYEELVILMYSRAVQLLDPTD